MSRADTLYVLSRGTLYARDEEKNFWDTRMIDNTKDDTARAIDDAYPRR
jgi:hypothetical protein